jgi:hypothetical protein
MTEEEWFHFIGSGAPRIVSVARLPPELYLKLGASNGLVKLRHDYALKIAHKHGFRPVHFPMLPIVIDCGRVLCDRPNHMSFFFYENVVFGGWLQATIKSARGGTELWVATFHPGNPKELRRLCKKHAVIREEKL